MFVPVYSLLNSVDVTPVATPLRVARQNRLEAGLVNPPTGMKILKRSVFPETVPVSVPAAVVAPVQFTVPVTVWFRLS